MAQDPPGSPDAAPGLFLGLGSCAAQAVLRLLQPMSRQPGVAELALGLMILLLSLALWGLTQSVWGWAALFVPGSCYVALGWARLTR